MFYHINWFESRAAISPNDTAIIDSDTGESWTYDKLHERAHQLANYFLDNGVEKGDRVAVLAPNHISYFDFLFAAMKIGAIFVPLNWRLGNDELNYVIKDSSPKIIGVTPLHSKRLIPKGNIKTITLDSNQYISRLKGKEKNSTITLSEADPLAMIYTGGTTGNPKGVVLSHRSIVWNALNTVVTWNLQQSDTTLTCLPMFHTGGLNVFSIPLLLVGGKVVISSEFHPEKAVNDLLKYHCTVVLFVPTMYHMLIQTDTFNKANFPHMRFFISGGAPCPHSIYQAFSEKGIAFKEGYGLTEAGPNNFYINSNEALKKVGSVGKPMLFNDIQILSESGEMAKTNETGELLIRGNHAFEYYWNNPEETKKTKQNGWIHTGDLARCDDDGYYYIVGRKKDMIITGGENVYPLEIEHMLETHPNIAEAAVLGLPDEKWGEIVAAFIVLKTPIAQHEIKNYCKQKLANFKVPKKIVTLNQLPKTHVGKVDKLKLKKMYKDK